MIGHYRRQTDVTVVWVDEIFDLDTFARLGVIYLPPGTGAIDGHGETVDMGTATPSISAHQSLLVRLSNDRWYRTSRAGLDAYMHRIGQTWEDMEEM